MAKSSSQTSPLPVHTIEGLVTRIKAEYIEVPDLQLTPWQAQRLWGLEPVQCDAILGALVDAAFLGGPGAGPTSASDSRCSPRPQPSPACAVA
jgi:hypothetical protein